MDRVARGAEEQMKEAFMMAACHSSEFGGQGEGQYEVTGRGTKREPGLSPRPYLKEEKKRIF